MVWHQHRVWAGGYKSYVMGYLTSQMVFITLLIVHMLCCGGVPEKRSKVLLSDEQLINIRDGFNQRIGNAFNAERGKPLVRAEVRPPLAPGRSNFTREYSFSLLEYATRCLYLNENPQAANEALLEYADYYLDHPETIYDRDNYRFSSEMPFRLIELFGKEGTRRAGWLWRETENKIMELGWLYCKRNPSDQGRFNVMSAPEYEESGTWRIVESENHHMQDVIAQWHFAKLAKDDPGFSRRLYDDGENAAGHFMQWQAYLKAYLTERAKKGMFIEMMSKYNTLLLKGIFNVYDFAEDTALRIRSGHFLDLYFAYWAEEQIDGISGGGKARIYNDISSGSSAYGYFFFGLGDSPPEISCKWLSAMTSSYRPPLVVVDIACDIGGRAMYEVIQRPLGLAVPGYNRPPDYRLRTDSGGIVRYSYCTPDFIMGTAISESRPSEDWTDISSQNRSHGIIFSGNHNARILPQCEKVNGRTANNTQWAVQRKGTLICQKLKTSKGAGNMQIWFAGDGLSSPVAENNWVFTEAADAYAAVRVVHGATHWGDSAFSPVRGKFLSCEDEYTPVILEVVRSAHYKSFEAFRDSVKARSLTFNNNMLQYKGMYGDSFTFYADYSGVPEINGVAVDYAPPKAFNSPFLEADWNSGIVTIQKGERKLILDFNEN